MAKQSSPKVPVGRIMLRLLRLAGKNAGWLYLALLLTIINTAITIAGCFIQARFIDEAIAGHLAIFLHYLWIVLALQVATVPPAYLRTRSIGLFSERLLAGLRERIAAQATILPMRYLDERHTGDLLSMVNADLAKIKNVARNSLLNAADQSLTGVAALVALFVISWPLALVTTLLVPLMMVIMSKLNQPVALRSQEMQAAIGDTVSAAQDGLGGLMVTRAFNLEEVMDERFRQSNGRAQQKGLMLSWLQAASSGSGMLFSFLPFLITLGFGGWLAINGHLTFGYLLSFITLMNYVANPLSSLPPLISSISEAGGAAQRTLQVFDEETERRDGQVFPVDESVVVRFDHVSFSYGEEPVLEDVSFAVEKGQTVAVVGPSGGGKSTLLKLLLGFYPVEGCYLFGHELSRWSLPEARRQMAFVAQDTYLFPVSMAENIACGNPRSRATSQSAAGQAEIERAAKMANIHDFILSLPQGYQTQAGERGARLSGGQRQRLSLARAILKNAPILLLDEPTSALDTESEALVQEALERFMVGRTTIVIAHRLSTIRKADRVLVLEGGRIIEAGTHEELMARGGRYQELYLRQFLPETVPA